MVLESITKKFFNYNDCCLIFLIFENLNYKMFGSNKLYTGFTNLNESISNESNENFLSLSPTKIKKSSIKSFDNYKRKSVQILEKTDENDIIIHLSQGESIEMIIYNEKTKEYEFTSNASEVFFLENKSCIFFIF